jgi:alpha-beta hydrolase superfamily lysophospholipase
VKMTAALVAGFAASLSASPIQTATDAPDRATVVVDGHAIAVWSRRPPSPTEAVLLVHGRTWSARPDWDLQVAGEDRSVLRSLATRGVAAYALDLRGYGDTPRDGTGWNTPRRSTDDVLAVLEWIRQQHPRLRPPTLVGWSRGGAIAMMAAQFKPAAMSSLVLFGFSWDPEGAFPEIDDPQGPPAKIPNTAEAAASDFISPRVTSPALVKAFVAQALRADPVLADLKGDGEYKVLAAERVIVPTLVIFGSRDPAYERGSANRFVAALSTGSKRLLVLPGADHAAHLENTHVEWVNAVAAFARTAK